MLAVDIKGFLVASFVILKDCILFQNINVIFVKTEGCKCSKVDQPLRGGFVFCQEEQASLKPSL